MKTKEYKALQWFRISVVIGFVLNLIFIVPGLFAPRFLESLIDVGTTNTVHWLQNVSILLAIVTTMYIPAIQDPFRYEFISYLLVAGRFSAGLLFLIGVLALNYPEGMSILAKSDLILSSIQAVLLILMFRDGDPKTNE
ncbi:MAG: hypothetical protein WBM44_18180 [Waterburya sp.]